MEASRATTATAFALGGVRQVLADYLTLTKPRVQLLLLLTTITTMYVAGDPSLGLVALTVLGGSLSAGRAPPGHPWWGPHIPPAVERTAPPPGASGGGVPRGAPALP